MSHSSEVILLTTRTGRDCAEKITGNGVEDRRADKCDAGEKRQDHHLRDIILDHAKRGHSPLFAHFHAAANYAIRYTTAADVQRVIDQLVSGGLLEKGELRCLWSQLFPGIALRS